MKDVFDVPITKLEGKMPDDWNRRYPLVGSSDRIVPLLKIARSTNNAECPDFMEKLDNLVSQFEGKIRVILPPFKDEKRGFDKLHPECAQNNFIERASRAKITVHATFEEALGAR
jgi:hypothetical protein